MPGKILKENAILFDRTLVIVGNNSLILIEPGYDAAHRGSYTGSSVEEIITLSRSSQKIITHLIYSHYHGDHVGNIPFYLKRIPNAATLVSHISSPIPEQYQAVHLIKKEQTCLVHQSNLYEWGGNAFQIIPTPGHSFHRDDISVYLPNEKILCVGDLWQPQGKCYGQADGPSPIPFFFYGDDYLTSLETLCNLDFDILITGHGNVFSKEEGLCGLQITRNSLLRIQALAQELIEQNPREVAEMICSMIYDAIVIERQFNIEIAQQRKRFGINKKCDYEVYDRPGLKYFAHQVLEKGKTFYFG